MCIRDRADVAAKEAKITAKRKTEHADKHAKQQAEKLAAAAALRREQELQAIRQATEADSADPGLADPGLADPALAAPELPAPINPQGTRPAQPVAPKPKPASTPASDFLRRGDSPQRPHSPVSDFLRRNYP